MPLIENAEIYFATLDPARPNAKWDKENPKWEVQMRTSDFERVTELKDLGIKMRLMTHNSGESEGEPITDEQGRKQWRYTFKKSSTKALKLGGGPAAPPELVDGDMEPVDPTIIGNGTLANLDIFQYTYGDNKIACVLMGVQIVKLVYYKQSSGFVKAAMQDTVYPDNFEEDHSIKKEAVATEDSEIPFKVIKENVEVVSDIEKDDYTHSNEALNKAVPSAPDIEDY